PCSSSGASDREGTTASAAEKGAPADQARLVLDGRRRRRGRGGDGRGAKRGVWACSRSKAFPWLGGGSLRRAAGLPGVVGVVGVTACAAKTGKTGTLLVAVSISGGAAVAKALSVTVAVDGRGEQTSSVSLPAAGEGGTIEVRFPSYPVGKLVTVTVTALDGLT